MITHDMKVYAGEVIGSDGNSYFVRYLLSPEHLAALQQANILGMVAEVIGMSDCAAQIVAGLEKQMYTSMGGLTQ